MVKEKLKYQKQLIKQKKVSKLCINFESILYKIEGHLKYEKDMSNELCMENISVKYSPHSYRVELTDKILSKVNKNNDERQLFINYILLVDLNRFENINENIYSEVFYSVIDIIANLNNCPVSIFVKDLYQYYNQQLSKENLDVTISKLKDYLKLSEAYSDKLKSESDSNLDENINDNGNKDNNSVTNILGIKQIDNLLFQYNITDNKDLNKLLYRSRFIHIFNIVVVLCSLYLADYYLFNEKTLDTITGTIPLITLVIIITIIIGLMFIYICAFKFKKKIIKRSLVKVYTAASISESEVYEQLNKKFGKKFKKLLQH